MNARSVLRVLLPVLILGVGGAGAKQLMSRKKPASRADRPAAVASVEYVAARAGAPAPTILGTGTVEGDRTVALSALVAGEVVFVADALAPGGRFRAGETILRVDPRDYEAAVVQERSRVRQAELELELELERQRTVAREWELLGGGKDAADAPLALRRPQLDAVQRAVDAARAGLERASANLERTALVAPFNALVLSESAERGQLLAPGSPVVTLVGTDRFRVRVAVPVEALAGVDVPGLHGPAGAPARITQDLPGSEPLVRDGVVLGLAGQLVPQTRTAELFVGVPDPLDGGGPVPLLPGAFVSVAIAGRPLPGAVTIPRAALVDGSAVWLADPDDRLARRDVVLAGADRDLVYVASGLQDGDRVVVTPLSLPLHGAPVRPLPLGGAAAPPAEAAAPAAPSSGG